MIGIVQATEAVKLILGTGEPLVGRLMLYDALGNAVPRIEAAAQSRVPGLRRPSDDHRTDRLSGVLRRAAAAGRSSRCRPRAISIRSK